MKLDGQSENGYAMAVLLVALSVMAVMMSVAMPVWRQAAQREKEAELVFRGQQYARAVGLFQRKYANTPPPDLDVLVRERFLRKKYKDPITNGDFVPIPAAQATAGLPGAGATGAGATGAGATGRVANTPAPARDQVRIGTTPITGGRGGIIGVTSSSKDTSIRIYNGATHYNEWRFVYTQPTATPGAGAPGTAAPGPAGRRGGPPARGSFGPGGFPPPAGRGPGGPAPTGGAPRPPVPPRGR